jgi:beta-lactamase class A
VYGYSSRKNKVVVGHADDVMQQEVAKTKIAAVAEEKIDSFEDIQALLKRTPGTYSLYIKNLSTNVVESYNPDLFYNAASVFKVFVGVSVMKNVEQKNINLDYYFKITPEDYEGGTGILQYEDVGDTYPVSELLSLAMKKSDNVAQNILIRAIEKKYIPDSTFTLENESSARKIGVFLENFYKNKYTSKTSRDYLLDLMKETDFDDRINLGLSNNLEFAHKIGNWPSTRSWHDCGIVMKENKAVVVCLLSRDTAFDDYTVVASAVGKFIESTIN